VRVQLGKHRIVLRVKFRGNPLFLKGRNAEKQKERLKEKKKDLGIGARRRGGKKAEAPEREGGDPPLSNERRKGG